jgi:glycosyltransferase involved in cell wall biosynthesis
VPAARLDLVGAHPQVDEPGVTGHGFLRRGDAQARRRVEDLFERATALVVPSCYEATGIVFVEAAAAGIPAIGTTAGGSGDLIGDAGFVVDPHDENGLVDAMLALADPAVAADLGARARRRASLYTWDLVAGRILRALRPAGVTGDSLPAFL